MVDDSDLKDLTEDEKVTLLLLPDMGESASLDDLTSVTGLPVSRVGRALEGLKKKGLLRDAGIQLSLDFRAQ